MEKTADDGSINVAPELIGMSLSTAHQTCQCQVLMWYYNAEKSYNIRNKTYRTRRETDIAINSYKHTVRFP